MQAETLHLWSMTQDWSPSCCRTSSRKDVPEEDDFHIRIGLKTILKGDLYVKDKPLVPLQSFDCSGPFANWKRVQSLSRNIFKLVNYSGEMNEYERKYKERVYFTKWRWMKITQGRNCLKEELVVVGPRLLPSTRKHCSMFPLHLVANKETSLLRIQALLIPSSIYRFCYRTCSQRFSLAVQISKRYCS